MQDWDALFRYPLDRREQASIHRHFVVNVPNFCHQTDELLNLLDVATNGLREIRSNKSEQMYQAQDCEN